MWKSQTEREESSGEGGKPKTVRKENIKWGIREKEGGKGIKTKVQGKRRQRGGWIEKGRDDLTENIDQ